MRFLWFVSLCLLFAACSVGRKLESPVMPVMLRASGGIEQYNLEVDFMRKHFSGMLLVKQMATEQYRAVFTTYFGLKIFDLEFSQDTMKVHYCVEPMRKERMLHLFRNDFSMLFGFYPKRMLCKGRERVERITTGRAAGRTIWLFPDEGRQLMIRHPWIGLRMVLTRMNGQ